MCTGSERVKHLHCKKHLQFICVFQQTIVSRWEACEGLCPFCPLVKVAGWSRHLHSDEALFPDEVQGA